MLRYFTKAAEEEELDLEKYLVDLKPELGTVFYGFLACRQCLRNVEYRDVSSHGYNEISDILRTNILDILTKFDEFKERVVLGNRLARIGFVQDLVDYYKFAIKTEKIEALSDALVMDNTNDAIQVLVIARQIIWSYTDQCPNFAKRVSETDMLPILINDLVCIQKDVLTKLEDTAQSDHSNFAFYSAVRIIYNCAKNPFIARAKFRDVEAVEALSPYLACSIPNIKLIVLVTLLNLIKEQQIQTLAAKYDVTDCLIGATKEVFETKDRQVYGLHLFELVDGLTALTKNDYYKRLIISKCPLKQIVRLLYETEATGIIAASKLLWELAFLDENKQLFLRNANLLTALKLHKNSSNRDIKDTTGHVWLVIRGNDIQHPNEPDEGPRHVMISYSSSDRNTALKIYHTLKNDNYPVWIDVAEIHKYSNIAECMAHGVDKANVIVVCFSENYKNSQRCRTEAEYAFTRKKAVIPLKLENGYDPDGWLGTMIGVRFYIEFSNNCRFDGQMARLKDFLRKYVTIAPLDLNTSDSSRTSRPTSTPWRLAQTPWEMVSRGLSLRTPFKRVQEWNKDDIEQWAAQYKLDGNAYKKVSKLSNDQIKWVYKMWKRSPAIFYRWAESLFKLGSIEDLVRFQNAVQALERFM